MPHRLHRRSLPAQPRRGLPWLALAATLLVSATASAPARADGFRCGSKLVVEGTSRGEVLARCGTPTDVEHRTILRRPMFWRHGRPYYVPGDMIEVPVETWTYNLGPNKLMRRLRIDDGIVVEIETLGYGYRAE